MAVIGVEFSRIIIYDCKRLFTSFRGKRSERKVKERVKFKGTILKVIVALVKFKKILTVSTC